MSEVSLYALWASQSPLFASVKGRGGILFFETQPSKVEDTFC